MGSRPAGNVSRPPFHTPVARLEVPGIGPPSSQKSIVRASRCNRTNEGPSWVPVYGPSRGAYADYRGSRRDCDSQPMLIRRELRSGALIAAERVELRPRVGSGSSRCGCAIPRGRPLRGTMREPVMQSSRTRRLCRTNGISLSATHCHRWNSDDEGRFPTRTHGEAPGNSKDLLLGRRVRIIGSAGEPLSGTVTG